MISDNDKRTIAAIEKYRLGIGRVADEKLTEAVCCYFVEQNPNVLQNIPSHKRTESVILAAVNKNGSSIIATHTPKEYWSKRGYNSNWIYINGHTHNNFYEISDRCTVYADNQIGYTPCPINAKHFY